MILHEDRNFLDFSDREHRFSKHLAGYEGIICGASAIYAGVAGLLNEMYGKTVLPIGRV